LFINDPSLILKTSIYAETLKSIRSEFITKKIFKTYMGYIASQVHKLKNEGNCGPSMNSRRFEDIQKNGFDTKAASHIIRLLCQGIELARNKHIKIPLEKHDIVVIKMIRDGKIKLEEVIDLAESFIEIFKDLEKTSTLPAEANFNFIDGLVIQMHRQFYRDNTHK